MTGDDRRPPIEIADQLTPEAKDALIAEALAQFEPEDWQQRRSWFLRDLDTHERAWFDE